MDMTPDTAPEPSSAEVFAIAFARIAFASLVAKGMVLMEAYALEIDGAVSTAAIARDAYDTLIVVARTDQPAGETHTRMEFCTGRDDMRAAEALIHAQGFEKVFDSTERDPTD